jgi:hypothetical protein
LFSMSFNRESASVFSMELTCLVEKCFGRGGKSNSVLLASTDGYEPQKAYSKSIGSAA